MGDMNKRLARLPKEFIRKLRHIFPEYADKILFGLKPKKRSFFRINRIKIKRADFVRQAINSGIKIREISWYKDAFILVHPSQREFQETIWYKEGMVYLQNPSSMLPVLFMDLEYNQKILDLCAAPGSKTTQIMSHLENGCELVAVEKIKVRFYKLKANLERQGVKDCNVILGDGSFVFKRYPEYFDRILVDVPCSAEGRFNVEDRKTFSYWSQRKVREMASKQKKLLRSAILSLACGGRLVYSTCTFSPEENEKVIEWAMDRFPDMQMVDIKVPVKNAFKGINGVGWHIIPDDMMEGFYICVLEKRDNWI